MLAKLKKAGLSLSAEDALKRAPRGFEAIDDPEIAAAARLKSLVCLRPVPEAAIASPALVDDFCAFAARRAAAAQMGLGRDRGSALASTPPMRRAQRRARLQAGGSSNAACPDTGTP